VSFFSSQPRFLNQLTLFISAAVCFVFHLQPEIVFRFQSRVFFVTPATSLRQPTLGLLLGLLESCRFGLFEEFCFFDRFEPLLGRFTDRFYRCL
jgi:hypothetical protein